MKIEAEITTKPGEKTLLVIELRIERDESINPYLGWWGLWFTFWLFKPRHWREMGWKLTWNDEERWRTCAVRLLGFEITWQRKEKGWSR